MQDSLALTLHNLANNDKEELRPVAALDKLKLAISYQTHAMHSKSGNKDYVSALNPHIAFALEIGRELETSATFLTWAGRAPIPGEGPNEEYNAALARPLFHTRK